MAEPASIKQEELTEENPILKKGKKASHKLNRQDEISEPTLKHEEESSLVTELESKNLGDRKSEERGDNGPFKTLEKGVIFFFYRSRVNSSGAHGIQDIARSFIVLRPAPPEAALDKEKGSSEFGEKFRLLVVPKKVLPKSGGEKEMAFVEKAGISLKELQETFMGGFDYETKTHGARTMPEAKLYGNGVYAIISAEHGSYLAYILTNPKILGPVQEGFGLHGRGSWLVQSKNPNFSSPPSASLPSGPEYPESFGEKFGDLRWVPLRPELIDYPNAQLLLIGRSGVKHEGREEPDEQLEEMAHENYEREMQFRGVDMVYGDLGLEVCHYPKISTTWDHV